jgi:hypothetical protein
MGGKMQRKGCWHPYRTSSRSKRLDDGRVAWVRNANGGVLSCRWKDTKERQRKWRNVLYWWD